MTPAPPSGITWDDQSASPLQTPPPSQPSAVDASHPAIQWDDEGAGASSPPPSGNVGDVFIGAGKGLLSTAAHTADLAQRMTGTPPEKRLLQTPDVQRLTTPSNPMQSIGYGAEQGLESLAPMGVANKAEKAIEAGSALANAPKAVRSIARILGKSIVQGGAASALAGAQTGGDPTAMRNAGLTAGAVSGVLQSGVEGFNAMKPFVADQTNAVERQALQWFEQQGLPVSTGQATQSKQVQRIEQGLENFPGGAAKSQGFFKAQEPQIANIGRTLAASISPTQTNAYGAGKTIENALQGEIASLKGDADNLYGQVRSAVSANPVTKQVGTKATGLVDANGNPITTPVMQEFHAPIDTQTLQAQLKPVYDDLTRLMPVARQQSSPAFQALSDLMKSKDPAMDAMDFDKYLSAVKSIARDGDSPYLTTRSQGLAKQIIGTGEQELNNALSQADPNIPSVLQQARSKVKAYYDVADLLGDIQNSKEEPAALYKNLVTGGDATFDTLQRINAVDPDATAVLGRAYIDTLLDRATSEGGFNRAAGLFSDWNRMGPQTKELLFGGPTAVSELNNFFHGAKMLTENANPSGTAKMVAALGPLGVAFDMAFMPGSLQEKAKRAAVELPAGIMAVRGLSKLLLSPGGRQFLTSAMRSVLPAVVGSGVPQAASAVQHWSSANTPQPWQPPPQPPPVSIQ